MKLNGRNANGTEANEQNATLSVVDEIASAGKSALPVTGNAARHQTLPNSIQVMRHAI